MKNVHFVYRKEGPTAAILREAKNEPGGVMRWGEAEMLYRSASYSARREYSMNSSRRSKHFHMSLQRILRKYFTKVEGIRGFYVLNEFTKSPCPADCQKRYSENEFTCCW